MSQTKDHNSINRRDFLKLGVLGATTAAVGLSGIGGISEGATLNAAIQPVYRTLGKTGLKPTVVSFGAMLTPEHEVMRAAFDLGVNYVDTARRYMDGRNEEIVAKAIKGLRNKIYVATKTLPTSNTKKDIFNDVETSLSKLQIDYIDVIQLHNLKSKERAFIPRYVKHWQNFANRERFVSWVLPPIRIRQRFLIPLLMTRRNFLIWHW